jgi:ATP-dependent DNA helicase RecQ
VVLLPGQEDQDVWRYFSSVAFPSEAMVRNVIDALELDRPQSTPALEPLVDLGRTRLEMVLKVLDVDGAVRRVKGGWVGTGQPWEYDEARYRKLDEARKREQQAMLDYRATGGCRMAFLRGQLDDPELAADERCGRCDNCTGARFRSDVDPASAEQTRQRLMRPGVEISPRKQWPSGLAKLGVPRSGKIGDGPAPGRVIGRLTDLGWGARLRGLLDAPDAEVSNDVVQAAVKVLASWEWTTRPAAVLAMDSDRHPLLISSLARALAKVGRLTDLGLLQYAPERRPVTAANSAYRVAALEGAWQAPDPAVIGAAGSPILLVDDMTDTGWTLTMGARVVRAAGAPEVLPFALASTS